METNKLTRNTKKYHGVVVPMVTPFTPDGELDEPAVRRVIDHLIEGGVDGIFVLGTTGEEASIPLPMRSRLVAITIEHIDGRVASYAGISHNCLSSSLDAAADYARLGIDVLVARLPTYYALTPEEQHAYFETLVERLPAPLMLYNISSTTHMTIPIEVVEALGKHPQVVGIKDSDNDLNRLGQLLERLGGWPDFSVLVGVSSLSVQVLSMGADGLVPSPGNLVPRVCHGLYQSALQGDMSAADAWQQKLEEVIGIFRHKLTLGQSLGTLKAALGALNLCGPHVLPPLVTPDAAQQGVVREMFRNWLAGQDWTQT